MASPLVLPSDWGCCWALRGPVSAAGRRGRLGDAREERAGEAIVLGEEAVAVVVGSGGFEGAGLTGRPSQTERAYLKQPIVFEYGKHRKGVGKEGKKGKTSRFVRNVGLGFKTPKLAATGKYVDRKCPWTGNVSIRGRILRGRVVSNKMKNTVIVRRDSLHYIRKYNRYEKRHANTAAHCSPAFLIKEGDTVTIGECRPLSKTVRFNVLEHQEESSHFQQKNKLFRIF